VEKGQGARDGRVGKTGPIIDCLIHKMTTCRGNRVACVRFLYPDQTFCTHICLHLNRSNLPKLSGGNENIIISTQLKIIVTRLRYMGRIVVALLLASLSPKVQLAKGFRRIVCSCYLWSISFHDFLY